MRRLPPRIGSFSTSSVIVVAVAVVIVVVLLVARACGSTNSPTRGGGRSAAAASASGSASTGGDTDGADGAGDQPPDASPSVAAGQAAPTVVAEAFAHAWVLRTLPGDQWRAGLQPLTTPAAFASLAGVDPLDVPAERVTGGAQIVLSDVGFAQCQVPLDFGSLQLRVLSQPDGRWLVDGIGWDRS
jgi:hypothetical protein